MVVAAATLLSSCKVDVSLGVRVSENGSGTVRLQAVADSEAVDAVGGDLEESLRVADLVHSGWIVDVEQGDDGATVSARRDFGTPEQFAEVMQQVSGTQGPFRAFRLERNRSAFRTEFSLRGSVDIGDGVGRSLLDPGDEGVAAELGDEGVGVDDLRAFLSDRVDDAFEFEVVVALPGDGAHDAPGEIGGEPRWEPAVGEVTSVAADSSVLDVARIAWLALGALLAVAAVGVLTGPALAARIRGRDGPRARVHDAGRD